YEFRATSVLTRTEVASGIARAQRVGRVTGAESQVALARFAAYWPSLARSGVDEELALSAGELARQHELRAYDAVHLATALRVAVISAIAPVFATTDRQLAQAARRCGLTVWPDIPDSH
ncbi:MAG: type II toxin-antitoxin system VapC family toxin, partial [Terriglobales bacterium]